MKLSKQIFKNSIKSLTISGLVGLSALGLTGGLMNHELYAATTTPALYSISELSSTLYAPVPNGYVKPSYTFNITDESQKATANALSPADAAEIMSQEIYRYLKTDISGKTINLTYRTEYGPIKSSCQGVLEIDSLCTIFVNIDSITGELNFINAYHIKPMNSINNFVHETYWDTHEEDFKRNLETNCKKVKELINSSGWLPEEIKSVTYRACQGFLSEGEKENDPPKGVVIYHGFNVTTVSGKVYKFYISEDLNSIYGIFTPHHIAQFDRSYAINNLM